MGILRMPKAVRTINQFSRSVAGEEGKTFTKFDLDWREDITGTTFSKEDKIDLGTGGPDLRDPGPFVMLDFCLCP